MIATILIGLVALIHVYIVVLEMVLWDTPRAVPPLARRRSFQHRQKYLLPTRGSITASSLRGSRGGSGSARRDLGVKVFFLLCVLVAGLYGAATASMRILYVQAVPAALALLALWIGI
ncbi:DUF1304 domain-containing protein [Neoaquamicrobium sediminum]|uniref:DUF1304 domain-containing protein n=1 Tax=Neoaquamicrobium sediminum TaxID=1849104 RepID=UPI0035E3FCFD